MSNEEKGYEVVMTVTGRASAIVKAKSKLEAKIKARKMEFEEGSDDLIEWEWDDIESITEEQ